MRGLGSVDAAHAVDGDLLDEQLLLDELASSVLTASAGVGPVSMVIAGLHASERTGRCDPWVRSPAQPTRRQGGSVKTKAAILWEVGKEWSVEEIELDAPKAG